MFSSCHGVKKIKTKPARNSTLPPGASAPQLAADVEVAVVTAGTAVQAEPKTVTGTEPHLGSPQGCLCLGSACVSALPANSLKATENKGNREQSNSPVFKMP